MQQIEKHSLGRLARRISAWTTNCLLSLMLVVISLGFGREVLHWWHDGPKPSATPGSLASSMNSEGSGHVLQFGDQAWTIRRAEFSGSAEGLGGRLQAMCRAAIDDCRPRGESPDAAEGELLTRLAAERPVAEEQGQWRLYQWGGSHPVLVGTRAFSYGKVASDLTSGTRLAETTYRVVVWGLAVPAVTNVWNLYLFQTGGSAGGQQQVDVEIPLPSNACRLMSIRSPDSAIMAFATNDGDSARAFYTQWFAAQGWTIATGWRQMAAGWHARYEKRAHVPPLAADLRLGNDVRGGWTGLMMESPLERRDP